MTSNTSAIISPSAGNPPLTVLTDFQFDEADRERLTTALAPGRLILVGDQAALRAALTEHPSAQVVCTFARPET